MSTLMRSKSGETKTREEWQKEVDDFWDYAELQNRYICNPRAKFNRRVFKRPNDAFERFAKIIGLEEITEISWEGVF